MSAADELALLEATDKLIEIKSKRINKEAARCSTCGELGTQLYVCDRGHGKIFCKDCLRRVNKINEMRSYFFAQCKNADCCFLPI